MKPKLTLAVLGIIVITALLALAKFGPGRGVSSGKLTVTASFYPVAEFARQVGGDKVSVTTLVQPGVEPHDYEPTPTDLAGLYRSKLFVYNGAGLEHWIGRVRGELDANRVTTVEAASGIELREVSPDSGETGTDPHIWLDPVRASAEVTNIEAGLIKADPANAAYYRDRAAAYQRRLADLDRAYRDGLGQCTRRDIVTSHQAFSYLAQRYGLQVTAIAGLSPEEEPSPQKLAEVAAYAREHDVRYIFFETLASPKLSETIAREVGARTLVFNPLEGLTADEAAAGQDYLSVQRANLNNVRIALDCK